MDSSKVFKSAAQGLSLLVLIKLVSKFLQIFLNFAIIRVLDPVIYGYNIYFQALLMFITFLNKDCLQQAYQRRLSGDKKTESKTAKTNEDNILKSSKNLVNFFFIFR